MSLSPEQFFTLRGGTVEARPMKGTAPRRADPAADRAEAEDLAVIDRIGVWVSNFEGRDAGDGAVEV